MRQKEVLLNPVGGVEFKQEVVVKAITLNPPYLEMVIGYSRWMN